MTFSSLSPCNTTAWLNLLLSAIEGSPGVPLLGGRKLRLYSAGPTAPDPLVTAVHSRKHLPRLRVRRPID